MATASSVDRRAWRGSTLDDPKQWYYVLPSACQAALETLVRQQAAASTPLAQLKLPEEVRKAHAGAVQSALDALERGRGFAIIRLSGADRYSHAELTTFYWLVGQLLGLPMEQNVQGTVLYDVRDTGQDVRYGARFSVTNAESSFHTDNSFGEEVCDYVGLLCLNPSRTGGLSQMVSGLAARDRLRQTHPEVLDTLAQTFHIDRRGGLREGDKPTIEFPVMQSQGDELMLRYLRYWIEVGHEKIAQPLTAEQKRALDLLDEALASKDLHAEFSLQPGDMYFINNRWILHNRTAYEDFTEPERKRHLIRLWLRTRAGTPEAARS